MHSHDQSCCDMVCHSQSWCDMVCHSQSWCDMVSHGQSWFSNNLSVTDLTVYWAELWPWAAGHLLMSRPACQVSSTLSDMSQVTGAAAWKGCKTWTLSSARTSSWQNLDLGCHDWSSHPDVLPLHLSVTAINTFPETRCDLVVGKWGSRSYPVMLLLGSDTASLKDTQSKSTNSAALLTDPNNCLYPSHEEHNGQRADNSSNCFHIILKLFQTLCSAANIITQSWISGKMKKIQEKNCSQSWHLTSVLKRSCVRRIQLVAANLWSWHDNSNPHCCAQSIYRNTVQCTGFFSQSWRETYKCHLESHTHHFYFSHTAFTLLQLLQSLHHSKSNDYCYKNTESNLLNAVIKPWRFLTITLHVGSLSPSNLSCFSVK